MITKTANLIQGAGRPEEGALDYAKRGAKGLLGAYLGGAAGAAVPAVLARGRLPKKSSHPLVWTSAALGSVLGGLRGAGINPKSILKRAPGGHMDAG